MLQEMPITKEIVEEVIEEELLVSRTYQIVLHDDNVTPIDLVFIILIMVFELAPMEAIEKIEEAEKVGKVKVKGDYTFSQASEKVSEADHHCEEAGFKLTLTIEEE